ncbi:NYN domain-containing protein [candidate division KSB3 bacterium]|uniref:NYN domain-containing protein n=1 Tax=candidate division KSB3 bacterium TaxID=2044937 RepID=A0A2G6E244_9BACT|nr:MAG: NYN domain-containing protein [candidate division KSB3 bacterium]PIE28691.1 MAG: NYN domain-containing protein [candidate division KSB3 bacterium]
MSGASRRVGLYVDVANLAMNGGYGMRYDVLREFACRDNAEPIRLNAYVSFDGDRSEVDYVYKDGQYGFYSLLRDFGYKVIQKNVKWYVDESGNRFGKANADLDMAVDVLLQSNNMDRVVLVTGDGDFVRVVQALQNSGCRVEVVAFENVSAELRREADMFISGYLIPNLLPTGPSVNKTHWGRIGSRMRGVCYNHSSKGYGFLRAMKTIAPDLWRIDSRQKDSPYYSVFFHDSQLPEEVSFSELPSRSLIFEFEVADAEGHESGMQAKKMQLVSPQRRLMSAYNHHHNHHSHHNNSGNTAH